MKVLTNLTAIHERPQGEVNNLPSETIPDQAVSAQELLRRFATGAPLGFKNATPVYDEDPENPIPELYKMNTLDRLHHLQENSENLMEKRSEYNDFVNKQKKEAAQKAADDKQKEQPLTEDKKANSKRSEETAD